MDAKRLVSIVLFSVLSCLAFSDAYAATPLINCTGSNKALQSTASPPNYSCATISGGGGVTTTGSPSSGQMSKFSGSNTITNAVGDTDYQRPITLTTTGTSGAASFTGDVLNIPQYSGGGGSGTVSSGTIGNAAFYTGATTVASLSNAAALNRLATGLLVDPRDPQFGSNTCTGYYGIATSHKAAGGSGYAVNDTFQVAAATPGANYATGHVTGVSAGVVTSYSIDNAGGAYNIVTGQTLGTTATSGAGSGFTIAIDTASTGGNDDTAAIHSALVYATSIGAAVLAPTGCWVSNLTLPLNSTIEGAALSPTYGYDSNNTPVWFVFGNPTFGLNATGSANIGLANFQVSGIADPGAFSTTACIGGSSQGGAFFGSRNFAYNMAGHHCAVGLGTPDGTGGYILWTSINSDWSANGTAGIYGPFSDFVSLNDTATSENYGIWLPDGSGGLNRIIAPRLEYLNINAIRLGFGGLQTNMDAVQVDRSGSCAIYASSTSAITVNGGVFKATGLGGTLIVSNATNNGSGAIRLTVSGFGSNPSGGGTPTSGVSTGDVANVANVGGTTEANGGWTVTVVDGTHIDLQGSTFTHAYTSGGNAGIQGKDATFCLNRVSGFHTANVENTGYSAGANLATDFIIDSVSSDNIGMIGGEAQPGNSGYTGSYRQAYANWQGGTPAHVNLDVGGNAPFRNDNTVVSYGASGNVGFGTNSPNSGAGVDMSGWTNAVLLPAGTTGQRPACTGSFYGIRYNTTIAGFEGCNGTSWSGLGQFLTPVAVPTRVVTASGAVTVSATTDYMIIINKTVGAATTVNLPSSPITGLLYIIKDGKGDAATNNITVTPAAGTIDGSSTAVMATNYQVMGVVYNGTQWNVE